MAIELRLFGYLPDVSSSKQRKSLVSYRDGLTVRDLLEEEGILREDLAIMVNGRHASAEAQLNDGDSVFFLPAIAGGSNRADG